MEEFCTIPLLKPYYIAYTRAHKDLLYKLDTSFTSYECLETPLAHRLVALSWLLREYYGIVIKFDILVDIDKLDKLDKGTDIIKCIYLPGIQKNIIRAVLNNLYAAHIKIKYPHDIDICMAIHADVISKIETIFAFWFERNFLNNLERLFIDQEINLKILQLPTIKRLSSRLYLN